MLSTMSIIRTILSPLIGVRGILVVALMITAVPSQALNLGDMSVAPGMAASFYVRVDYTGDATRTDEWVTLGKAGEYEALGLQLPAFLNNAEIKFFQTTADKGYLTVRAYRGQVDPMVDVVLKQPATTGFALTHYRILESETQISVTRRNMLILNPAPDLRSRSPSAEVKPVAAATAQKARPETKPVDVGLVAPTPTSPAVQAGIPMQAAPTIINLPDAAFVREPPGMTAATQNNAQVVSDILLSVSHDQFYVGALLLLLAISGLSFLRVVDRERQGRAYQMGYAKQIADLSGGGALSPFPMSPAAPRPPTPRPPIEPQIFEEFSPIMPAPASVTAAAPAPKTVPPAPSQPEVRATSPATSRPGASNLSAFDRKKMELEQRLNQQLLRTKTGEVGPSTEPIAAPTAAPTAAATAAPHPSMETKQNSVSRETAQAVELAMVYRRMGDLGTARALLQRLLDSCDSTEKSFVQQSLELINAL